MGGSPVGYLQSVDKLNLGLPNANSKVVFTTTTIDRFPQLGTEPLTAPFNNMRTLKFKAQPTNAFFAAVNQLFGGSSQLPTMLSERFDLITARSGVVGSWEELPNI